MCKAFKTTAIIFIAKHANLWRSLWLLKLPNMDEQILYYINSDDTFFFGGGGLGGGKLGEGGWAKGDWGE